MSTEGSLGPPTLTYAQVAAMLNRSTSYVERLVKDGLIPYHRIGRNIRFYRHEIQRWLDENDGPDSRIRPALPRKPGGAQYVFPADTLGDDSHCWCGEILDHDWPGKDAGAPHPHEHERLQQVVIVERNEERQRIDRGNMRGFHASLKQFLIRCVNTDGLHWRPIQNGILLFPPDESNAISVYCRNNDNQIRSLELWYAAHVKPYIDEAGEKVEQADVFKLAETVNDPVEHPVGEQWRPYVDTEGKTSEFIETNGTLYRCKACLGTDREYQADHVRGIGGHIRMNHRDTSNLRSPEAIDKNVDTRRYNRLHEKVTVAVELLAEVVGFEADTSKVVALEIQVDQLKAQVAAEKKRADDAEARIKLLNEAFRGLE